MEQEILDKVHELMDVRTEIIKLKARQQEIDRDLDDLYTEQRDINDNITKLEEKGRRLVTAMVLG